MKRAVAFILVLLLLTCMISFRSAPDTDVLTVTFIDVGQGDAALLQCGGQTLLIDGGSADYNQKIYNILKKDLKLKQIDYIISTHPHDDHNQGLATAAAVCKIGKVYSPVKENNEFTGLRDLKKQLDKNNIEIIIPVAGDTFTLGSARVEFLTDIDYAMDVNDWSLVVRIEHNNVAFLFTGDATMAAENALLDSGKNVKADVLKVGHHGASGSTGERFLEAVDPSYAVISVGADNEYGHPANETIKKLQERRIVTYRTDKNGTITCTSDGINLTFMTEKQNRRY